jgi:glycosyltransferase involved in cell wall biosynthesis
MNIAILAPHLRNAGGTKILFSYANELTHKGHEVTVYVRSTNVLRRTVANICQIGKPNWISLRARVIRVQEWDAQYITMHDHIIAGGYIEALALDSWNNTRGIGWYMVQHDEGLFHGPREAVDRALRSRLQKITVSSWLQEVVRERGGQESLLLLNPYDRTQFFREEKAPHETIRVLLLDHSYTWKGTDLGIQIVKVLQKKYHNVILVGWGRRRKDASSFYDEYHYDPPQDAIRSIYSGADIFLCPSDYEGFGLPSLEAMACGTAVVTFDNGGSRDFAYDQDTAYVVPHREGESDTLALQDALEDAIKNPEKRDKIAVQGNRYVVQMPTWVEQTEKLIHAFKTSHTV